LYDLVADPAESRPLPAPELARFGAAFVEAAIAARAHVATFRGRTDNSGEGRFGGD
jgi:hypothetical protein